MDSRHGGQKFMETSHKRFEPESSTMYPRTWNRVEPTSPGTHKHIKPGIQEEVAPSCLLCMLQNSELRVQSLESKRSASASCWR